MSISMWYVEIYHYSRSIPIWQHKLILNIMIPKTISRFWKFLGNTYLDYNIRKKQGFRINSWTSYYRVDNSCRRLDLGFFQHKVRNGQHFKLTVNIIIKKSDESIKLSLLIQLRFLNLQFHLPFVHIYYPLYMIKILNKLCRKILSNMNKP